MLQQVQTTVSNMPGDQTKTFDEKLMISSNKPTRKGYNFAGWSTSANGNVVYQPGAEYKNDQNGGTVTLYAKWTAWNIPFIMIRMFLLVHLVRPLQICQKMIRKLLI